MTDTQRKILNMLLKQDPRNPWLDLKQISKQTGRPINTVHYNLRILRKEGQVVGTGGGRGKGRHLFAHVSHNPQPPDVKETIRGSKIRDKIRKVLQEQSPEYPWLGIKQISQLTGRQRSTIQYHLSILLKEGQVVEDKLFKPYGYAHVSKVPDASAFKRTKRHEYVPKVSQGQQAEVLVALLMAFTKGYEWVVLDQIGAFDHPKLLDLKVNQLLQLLNRLIEEGMVTCSRHDEHLYYTLTRNGIIEAMKLAKRAR